MEDLLFFFVNEAMRYVICDKANPHAFIPPVKSQSQFRPNWHLV